MPENIEFKTKILYVATLNSHLQMGFYFSYRLKVVRLGARLRVRLAMMSWCLTAKFSAMRLLAPPGRSSLAMVTIAWTKSMKAVFIAR